MGRGVFCCHQLAIELASEIPSVLGRKQSWALALYFQVRSPLFAHFISMDRYRSSAHLANFQVRSLRNRSKKTSGSLSEKSAKTQNRS